MNALPNLFVSLIDCLIFLYHELIANFICILNLRLIYLYKYIV